MQMTLQKLNPESFQKLTATASDFHARLSVLLESDEALKILEELCFLKSCGWLVSESLNYYSQKTLQDFLTTRGGRTFGIIISAMDELGYDVEWQVLNSKNFGVPQNRERVFIIGHLRGTSGRKVFPVRKNTSENTTKQIAQLFGTEKEQNPSGGRVHGQDGIAPTLGTGHGMSQPYIGFIDMSPGGVITDTARNIQARHHKGPSNHRGENSGVVIAAAGKFKATEGDSIDLKAVGSKTRRGIVVKSAAHALDTQCNQGVLDGMRIRRLTPRECFRLQGFPDEYFDRAAKVNSDTQLYKQAGNSVTVSVIYEIARRFEPWEGEK